MSFKELFEKDYAMGKLNEKRLIRYLNKDSEKYFLVKNNFAYMDFKEYGNFKFLGELKSRNIKKDKHETAIIGKEKIGEAIKSYYLQEEKTYRFYYLYTDGLYKYDFNIEDIHSGKIYLGNWYRNSRGKEEKKKVFYIHRDLLQLVDKDFTSLSGNYL
tara:strand:- start:2124 stop:2597 length:474 start_codon:yes stop_codon:yes gene_type:complete